MDYEQRYNDALARAKEQLNDAKVFDYDNEQIAHNIRNTVYNIFPEFKDSEDEKIRKELTDYIKKKFESSCSPTPSKNILANWITWLEKQEQNNSQVLLPSFMFDDILALQCCMETVKKVQEDKYLYEKLKDLHDRVYDAYQLEKQKDNADKVELKDYNIDPHFSKPIDKVEPKFKVGDWVVIENIVYRIDNISRIYLILSTIDRTIPINYKYIQHNDNKIHLWTIKDAKEGDVLVSGINQPFIYNGKFTEDTVGAYCGIDINYDFVTKKYYSPENWDENWTGNNNIRPATKEQRNFLFRKMKEAGYEWNKEKKKLIKL